MLLILRYDGSFFFANEPDFADEVRSGVELSDLPRVVLIDGESINGIDATAIYTTIELNDEIKRANVELRFARVRANVMEIMQRSDIVEIIGSDHFYVSIQEGVNAFLTEGQEQ